MEAYTGLGWTYSLEFLDYCIDERCHALSKLKEWLHHLQYVYESILSEKRSQSEIRNFDS
jgi:hypothetical protein